MITTKTKNKTRVIQAATGYYQMQAATFIKKGETILTLRGDINPVRTRYSIQVGIDKHIEADPEKINDSDSQWRYLNHSCEPNAYLVFPEMKLLALKDLEPGEELLYNYLTTELVLAEPFTCNCGSKSCMGKVKGFKYLNENQRNQIAAITAPHLMSVPVTK